MKKAVLFVIIFIAVTFLYSCNSDGSADIWIFAESFNNQNKLYKIELSEVTAISDEKGNSEYECFINTENGKTILLTLYSENDGTVSSLSVTASAEDGFSSEAFCGISESAAEVLVKETDEDLTDVFDSLGISIPDKLKNAKNKYYNTATCSYSLVSNTKGVAFIAKLLKYGECTEKHLTLRGNVEENSIRQTEPESEDLSESSGG